MQLRKPKDLIAGLLFLSAGILVTAISSNYPFGTLRQMGPGFFPVVLGLLLCLLAALIIVGSVVGEAEAMEPWSAQTLRAALLILGGTTIFGLTVRSAGVIPSIFAMVLLGSLAMKGYGLKTALVTAVILSTGTAVVFGWMLALPLPLFGPMFGF
ncbi:tripartite tricarboxylate transporter TctB family protein [Paracoccus versutus]|uniref:Tripartite tricarboxylate transporter TctB family protein n=1 Tax=Paracoccus versutus TaxID=34007 RepID=A0A3D9XSG4_PARVE|nr:tripartite tricarboxylate transporter TctB family protein [Paracoccus versutus]REF73286.1 tripartite tricarboxylate transporter TctB family protein [Paracoccus versutus]